MTGYSAAYYEEIREGAQRSAEAVVPVVLDAVSVLTVVDVGCGEGVWAAEFERQGCSVVGMDGDYVAEPLIERFIACDLAEPLPSVEHGPFDLAVCLEVAEHLPPERAKSFIHDLCRLAPVVLFSAAIPGQGGEGHLNEQWPAYWFELFERQGFSCSMAPRWEIWDDDRVESWYRQNLMVATSQPERFPYWFDTPLSRPLPVVHPAFFADLMAFIRNMAAQGKIEWR